MGLVGELTKMYAVNMIKFLYIKGRIKAKTSLKVFE